MDCSSDIGDNRVHRLHLCVIDLLDSDLVMELDRSRDLEVKIAIGGL